MAEEQDCRESEWYRFSQDIEEVINRGNVTFAEDMLRGIQETVERTKRVTEGQRNAVSNVERASRRKPGIDYTRRYQGYWRKW